MAVLRNTDHCVVGIPATDRMSTIPDRCRFNIWPAETDALPRMFRGPVRGRQAMGWPCGANRDRTCRSLPRGPTSGDP